MIKSLTIKPLQVLIALALSVAAMVAFSTPASASAIPGSSGSQNVSTSSLPCGFYQKNITGGKEQWFNYCGEGVAKIQLVKFYGNAGTKCVNEGITKLGEWHFWGIDISITDAYYIGQC